MVLNVTTTPLYRFNTMQRLALGGQIILHEPCVSIEKFCEVYERFAETITAVIVENVDSNNYDVVLNNDICNSVRPSCKVVTLGVTTTLDPYTVEFNEYNPDSYE